MRLLNFICLVFILPLIFISCSYKQDQALFEQRSSIPDTGASPETVANISNYHIKPQDILQITNIQNSKNIIDLNAASITPSVTPVVQVPDTYQVEDDGTVALTGIGRVQVAGLTRVEARKKIEDLYGKEYLKHPILDVKIINLKVTMLGEVKTQGNFPLVKDRTNLIEMIGEAGGLTEKANEKNIKIIHSDQKTEVVDLSDVKALADPRIYLRNNDIIYVSQNKKAVRNNNVTNFSTIIQPVLILLNTALIIFTLTRR